jgi:ligand-binding SRPBCC domain-containing protein
MREFTLHVEQTVRAPLERVFAFCSNTENLERITPPRMCFRIQTARPIEMRAGTMIDYSLKLHGIGFRWKSEITVWAPNGTPARFVDEQRKGPYRYWIHEHVFERARDDAGATVVTDHVRYAVPGGAIVDAMIVRPQLERIFAYRADATRRLIARA